MESISLLTRADDLGSSHAANEAILRVAEAGFVKNISVMAVCPHLEEAAEMLSGRTDVAFGLHACVNSEWDNILWPPLSHPSRVPSLVDHRGAMHQTVELLAEAKPAVEEIICEYRCQLERLRKVGFHVTYLDSHMLPERMIPGLREAMTSLAQEERLIDHTPYNRFFPELHRISTEQGLFRSLLKEASGRYLLIMHPARMSEEMRMTGNSRRSGEEVAAQRAADLRFMTDPDTLKACSEFGVRLLRYDEAE